MKKIFAGLALLTTLTAVLQSCKSNTELKFNPAAGSKYRIAMTTTQDMEQEAMGQKMQVQSVADYTMLYEISKADGDDKQLKMTFERMKSTQKAMGKEMVMDSEVLDTANPGSQIIGAIKGSVFDMIITKKGEIKSMKGMDLLLEKMIKSAGENLPPETQAQMSEGIKGMMNDDMLRSLAEQSFKIFPDKKVKVGDSWKSKLDVKSFINMIIETTYTLNKVEGGLATLDVKSVITHGEKEKMIQGTKVETSLSGTQTGTMQLDVASGMVVSSTIAQKIDSKMKANGMEVPIKVTGTTTIKSTKL